MKKEFVRTINEDSFDSMNAWLATGFTITFMLIILFGFFGLWLMYAIRIG